MQSYFIEDLTVGMEAGFDKEITEFDLQAFAEVTHDSNPIHLDEDYAATTIFKTRIAHGMLSAGFISAVIGNQLPGPGAIYLSQTLKFLAPVRIGDTVSTRLQLTALDVPRKRAQFHCRCKVGQTVVVEGEALVYVPSRG